MENSKAVINHFPQMTKTEFIPKHYALEFILKHYTLFLTRENSRNTAKRQGKYPASGYFPLNPLS